MLGPFVNTVVMRCHIGPEVTFKELLRQTQAVAIDAYENQELAFEALVRVVETEQKIKRGDLFQALLVYDVQSIAMESCGLNFAPIGTAELQVNDNVMVTTFELIMNVMESSTRLTVRVNCKDGYVNGEGLASMNRRFQSIVEAVTGSTKIGVRQWCDSFSFNQ
jgi:non-ribosomal peptide synthetase component F